MICENQKLNNELKLLEKSVGCLANPAIREYIIRMMFSFELHSPIWNSEKREKSWILSINYCEAVEKLLHYNL